MVTTFNLNVTGLDTKQFDTLVIYVDRKKVDMYTTGMIVDRVTKLYPLKTIIALPDGIRIEPLLEIPPKFEITDDKDSAKILIQCKPAYNTHDECGNIDCNHRISEEEGSTMCPHHVFMEKKLNDL